jgi:adenylosuccinate synthase
MQKQAYVVTDLGYGDSGKGSITDFLVRDKDASLVIRYNGGAQAAHNVVLPDGRHHTFAQWGSGTFAGARTFLSKHMIVHPFGLVREAEHLISVGVSNPWGLLTIDERALVITPYQQSMNRIREIARGRFRHGSCGIGIGETVDDSFQEYCIYVRDLTNRSLLRRKLELAREAKLATIANLDLPDEAEDEINMIKDSDLIDRLMGLYPAIAKRFTILDPIRSETILDTAMTVVFEGAQGVLIDQDYGFHPHTTWSKCTDANARAMLKGRDFKVERVGVLRAYATRHGPGPFVPYDAELSRKIPDMHNGFHTWQREFRCGWFDVPATKYAITVNEGVDYLAITCMDRAEEVGTWGICTKYERNGEPYDLVPPLNPTLSKMKEIGDRLFECKPEVIHIPGQMRPTMLAAMDNIEICLGHAVGLTSRGPTHLNKTWEM